MASLGVWSNGSPQIFPFSSNFNFFFLLLFFVFNFLILGVVTIRLNYQMLFASKYLTFIKNLGTLK